MKVSQYNRKSRRKYTAREAALTRDFILGRMYLVDYLRKMGLKNYNGSNNYTVMIGALRHGIRIGKITLK